MLGQAEGTKSKILSELNKLNYNPLKDPLPIELLPNDLQNFFNKKKQILTNIKKLIKEKMIVEKNALIIQVMEKNEYINSVLFYLGIDVIVFYEKTNCIIFFNNTSREFYEHKGKSIKTKNIYNILKEYNINWILEKDKIYCQKNKESIEDIIQIIKINVF